MKSTWRRRDTQTNSASKFFVNFMDYNLLQQYFNAS